MKTQNLKDKSKDDCGCKDKDKEPSPETNVGSQSPVEDEEETVQGAIIGNRPDDRK